MGVLVLSIVFVLAIAVGVALARGVLNVVLRGLVRYAARNANFVLVAPRIAVLAAQSAARDTADQPRGGASWLIRRELPAVEYLRIAAFVAALIAIWALAPAVVESPAASSFTPFAR